MRKSDSEITNKVIVSAIQIFQKKGYKRTTVKEIADSSGVSNKQIKRLFNTKSGLFQKVFESEKQKVRKKLTALFDNSDKQNKQSVKNSLNEVFNIIRKNRFFIMVYEFEDFPVWNCVKDRKDNNEDPFEGHYSLLCDFIIDCQKTEIIRMENPIILTHILRIIFHMILREKTMFSNLRISEKTIINIFIDGLIAN
ncbi:TetR/AcrR family transcriptional regulator [candidate division KSB1 bacterium]